MTPVEPEPDQNWSCRWLTAYLFKTLTDIIRRSQWRAKLRPSLSLLTALSPYRVSASRKTHSRCTTNTFQLVLACERVLRTFVLWRLLVRGATWGSNKMQLHRKTQFQVSKSCAALKKLALHGGSSSASPPLSLSLPPYLRLCLCLGISIWLGKCVSSEQNIKRITWNSLDSSTGHAYIAVYYLCVIH